MGFVKTMEEIGARRGETGDFYDAEVLTVFFETNSKVAERFIPHEHLRSIRDDKCRPTENHKASAEDNER